MTTVEATSVDAAKEVLRRVARPMLAGSFVLGGYRVLRNPGPLPEYARQRGVPYPEWATRATATGMLVGGVALGAGVAPVSSAGLLAACLVPTTVTVHGFWWSEEPAKRRTQQNEFSKNVSLLGALALAAADGLLARRSRRGPR